MHPLYHTRVLHRWFFQTPIDSSAAGKGKAFMLELKKCLSQESFTQMMYALQVYKATDNLNNLMAKAADLLIQDPNTHILLRGVCKNAATDTSTSHECTKIMDMSTTINNRSPGLLEKWSVSWT